MDKNIEKNYWSDFWLNYNVSENKDLQSQVFRTRNNLPISNDQWVETLIDVRKKLELKSDDLLLDLCCGNGVFAAEFSQSVGSIHAIDINNKLIETLNSMKLLNVTTQTSNINDVQYIKDSYSKILWYAGIQYLDYSSVVDLAFKLGQALKKDGILLIGDIPDSDKLWNYFNTPERQEAYFAGIKTNSPIIGTWFEKSWIYNLFKQAGFRDIHTNDQSNNLIYSDFRFDLIAKI